jgi:hypothetical protein
MTNEAADRLRAWQTDAPMFQELLTEALSAEHDRAWTEGMAYGRRATVERIRERAVEFWSDEAVKRDYAFHPSLLFRWLDEEAAR